MSRPARGRVALGWAASGLLVVLAVWLAWLLYSGALLYRPLRIEPVDAATDGLHSWRGAVHVHTGLSHDASGSIEEIAAAAAAAGLDFLVVADHVRNEGVAGRVESGWYGDVLVIVGEEISTEDGHVLALGIEPHPYALGPTGPQVIADVRELGGSAFIAHPLGGEAAWTDGWAGAAGVEVISLSGEMYRSSTLGRLAALLAYPVNRAWAALRVVHEEPPVVPIWRRRVRLDDVPRRLAALGSVDAHGPPPGLRWLGVASHRDAFETLGMIVWLDEPPEPEPERHRVVAGRIVEALVAGRSAVVVDGVGTAPGLRIVAEADDGRTALPGDAAPWNRRPWTLRASLGGPGAYRIRLLRDDAEVAVADGGPLRHGLTEPGTYHVEVYRTAADGSGEVVDGPPWIIANPVYAWPSPTLQAARFRPIPPLPAPPVAHGLLDEPGWTPESHPGASSVVALGEPGLRWDLGLPREAGESVYAALSWRPQQRLDVAGRGGLVIGLRSGRPWRIAVRVAFAAADGEEVWERVVPSLPEGRTTGIPWSLFRPLGPPAGAPVATIPATMLERLVRVSLVVTQERVRPGTEASIEVLEAGMYGEAGPG